MGGLISRMQTLNSRGDFWNAVSRQALDQLKASKDAQYREVQHLVGLVERGLTLRRQLPKEETQLRARDTLALAAARQDLREPPLQLAVACDELAEERQHLVVATLGEKLAQHVE
jgi:hypothetical protein